MLKEGRAIELLIELADDIRRSVAWADRDSFGKQKGYCTADFAAIADRSCSAKIILKHWLERIDKLLGDSGRPPPSIK